MKLWHVIQWGNEKDGFNGWDTQCVVAAIDLKSAVEKAQELFGYYAINYRGGLADTVRLLGDDGRPDGEARLVIRIWVAFGDNLCHYETWHRQTDTGEWVDFKTMYGE